MEVSRGAPRVWPAFRRSALVLALLSFVSCGTPIRDFLGDASDTASDPAPCSGAADTPTTITFENQLSGLENTITVAEVDFGCAEKVVARISAGGSAKVDTFVTRVFRVRNLFTRMQIKEVVAKPEPLVVTIK